MRVLVTGITGFLGSRVAAKLSEAGHTVIGLTRDEHKFPGLSHIVYLGNLEHPDDVERLIQRTEPEAVIHAAALKVVPLSEVMPMVYVRTNVLGTWNLISSLPEEVPFLFVSTDKAVDPYNVYGLTKALAERLVTQRPGGSVVRFGNVFGSTGSVLRVWLQQAHSSREITVTDPRMTRFYVAASFAVDFILEHMFQPGLWVPKLKSYDLQTLVDAFRRCFSDIRVKRIPVRRGEKFHELLISPNELRFTQDRGDKYLISRNVRGNVSHVESSRDAPRLDVEFLEERIREFVSQWDL